MKRIGFLSVIMTIGILMISCEESNEDVSDNGVSQQGQAIGFDTQVNPTRVTYDPWIWENNDKIGLYAHKGSEASSTFSDNFLNNAVLTHNSNNWTYTPARYWPEDGNKVTFLAYWPHNSDGPSADDTGITIPWTVNDTPSQQQDLIYARVLKASGTNPSGANSTPGNTKLDFKHALSRVQFQAKKATGDERAIRITNLTISSLKIKGSLNIGIKEEVLPTWKYENDDLNFSIAVNDDDQVLTGTLANLPNTDLLMIPQNVADKTLTIAWTAGDVPQTPLIVTIPNNWEINKTYTYSLTTSAMPFDDIEFEVIDGIESDYTVMAYQLPKGIENDMVDGSRTLYYNNVKISPSGSYVTPADAKLWPDGKNMMFFAAWPAAVRITPNSTGYPTITYTPPTELGTDLKVATSALTNYASGKVKLNLSSKLVKVNFYGNVYYDPGLTADAKTTTLVSASLKDVVNTTGTGTFSASTSGFTWGSYTTGDMTYTLSGGDIPTEGTIKEGPVDTYLGYAYILPQPASGKAPLAEVTYSTYLGNVSATTTKAPDPTSYTAGNTVDFYIGHETPLPPYILLDDNITKFNPAPEKHNSATSADWVTTRPTQKCDIGFQPSEAQLKALITQHDEKFTDNGHFYQATDAQQYVCMSTEYCSYILGAMGPRYASRGDVVWLYNGAIQGQHSKTRWWCLYDESK